MSLCCKNLAGHTNELKKPFNEYNNTITLKKTLCGTCFIRSLSLHTFVHSAVVIPTSATNCIGLMTNSHHGAGSNISQLSAHTVHIGNIFGI